MHSLNEIIFNSFILFLTLNSILYVWWCFVYTSHRNCFNITNKQHKFEHKCHLHIIYPCHLSCCFHCCLQWIDLFELFICCCFVSMNLPYYLCVGYNSCWPLDLMITLNHTNKSANRTFMLNYIWSR